MVDWREIDNFLTSRGVAPICPMCEAESWRQGERAVMLVAIDAENQLAIDLGRGSSDGILCVPIVCDNCGFVRLHAPQVFDQANA